MGAEQGGPGGKPGPDRPTEPIGPARDDIRLARGPQRCPYCHAGVGPSDAGQVACQGCLARHHADCWAETGRCASCGGTRALEQAGGSTVPVWERRADPLPLLLVLSLGGVAAILVVGAGMALVTLGGDPAAGEAAPRPAAARAALDLSGDPVEVNARLRAAAQAGDPGAMNLLGFRLLQGIGCRPDPAEAYRWGLAAAEAGHAEAMFGVASLLARGAPGVPQDERAALGWYRRAAAAGDTMAGPALEELLARRPDLQR